MTKLTRAQRSTIAGAIRDIEAALAFLAQERIALCYAGTINSAVPHHGDGGEGSTYRAARPFERKEYTGRDNSKWSIEFVRELTPVSKFHESDLVRIEAARRALAAMLTAG